MADDDFWETIWTLWKILLGGFVFISVLLFVWVLYPEQGINVAIVAVVGVTVFLYGKAIQSRSPSDEIVVNYVSSHGIPIGGKLEIQPESLLYNPHDMEKIFRREPFEIPYEEIESIKRIPRFRDGFVAFFTKAGYKNRIEINLEDGSRKLFVSSDLDSDIEKLNDAMNAEMSDVP